jgi:hypothetical protein
MLYGEFDAPLLSEFWRGRSIWQMS